MSQPLPNELADRDLPLSIRNAARIAGTPREYIEECVAAGKLAVLLHHKGESIKYRVTRRGLEAAGIMPPRSDAPPVEHESLVQLLREQTERLAAIEEQRFHLAGQLGAALERNRVLEERVFELAASPDASETNDAPPKQRQAGGQAASEPQQGAAAKTRASSSFQLARRIAHVKLPVRWRSHVLDLLPIARVFGGSVDPDNR